jgi:hypothetical protein
VVARGKVMLQTTNERDSGSDQRGAESQPQHLQKLQEKQGFDTKWLHIWATSPERVCYLEGRHQSRVRIIVGLIILLLAGIVAVYAGRSFEGGGIAALLVLASCIFLIWGATPYWGARRAFAARKKALDTYRVDIALKRVCGVATDDTDSSEDLEPLSLGGLYQLNRRQLDEYQDTTRRQEQRAFQLTLMAGVMAFAILVGGVIFALISDPGPTQFVVAGLAGLGTLLSGFLSGTFFQAHRDAMDQMSYYYAEPAMTGKVLSAERISNAIAKRRYAKDLIACLLSWQPPLRPYRRDGEGLQQSTVTIPISTNGKAADVSKEEPWKEAWHRVGKLWR